MLVYDTLAFSISEADFVTRMVVRTFMVVVIACLAMAFSACGCAPAQRTAPSAAQPTPGTAPAAESVPTVAATPAAEIGTGSPRAAVVTPSDRVAPAAPSGDSQPSHSQRTSTAPASPFATAKAGSGAPVLKAAVPTRQTLRTGGSAPVAVYAPPQAIVTFQTRDGGIFPNGQATITVTTDDQGLARTIFTANPGTVDQVAVLAGSPGAMGTLSLFLDVTYSPSTDLKAVP